MLAANSMALLVLQKIMPLFSDIKLETILCFAFLHQCIRSSLDMGILDLAKILIHSYSVFTKCN